MYFSRAVLREDAGAAELAGLTRGDGYAAHQLVWRLFGSSPAQPRDFLFRDESAARRSFYLVSARPPEDRQNVWDLDIKAYAPQLRAGERLSFRLRANPVRSTRGDEGKVKRHDVVMDLKTRLKAMDEHEPLPPLPAIVQEAGFRWLSERAGRHGFRVDEGAVRVEGYRQHRLHKGRQRAHIQLSTVDYNGTLTVTDPELFQQALYRGVGPAKGFGCGLLMVKRL
jgi:CRISPR system Cascade subunit CasE